MKYPNKTLINASGNNIKDTIKLLNNRLDDYIKQADDTVSIKGATEFYYLISGNSSIDDQLPENQFLKKFKFVDDKLRLIDKDGRLIDTEGRHIDEYGNWIQWNEDGSSTKVDITGRAINEEGLNFLLMLE